MFDHTEVMLTKSEISNLGITGKINKDILRLEISVNDSQSVDMCQSFKDLPEKLPALLETHTLVNSVSKSLYDNYQRM